MRAQYPNRLKPQKYVKALTWEYRDKYPEFSADQIERPIDVIVGSVDFKMNEFQSIELKLRVILEDGEKVDEKPLSQCMRVVLYFYTRADEIIKYDVSERGGVEFPEAEKEKYMDFISEMTERVVNDVCRETELKISEMSDKENRLNSREEEGDFAAKVSEREADGYRSKKSKSSHAH